jgi:glycosyltransferase involved in cell wall biosynthesis
MSEKLTVLVAVKDHQDLIVGCLASALGIADEVLVADSGSRDGTIETARSLCQGRCECNVIRREYITAGSFKNWAIPQARHGWVLIIDVDERLTDKLTGEIGQLLDDGPKADGYWIHRENYFLGHRVRFGGWNGDRVIRLFRRDLFRYPDQAADHTEFLTDGLAVERLRFSMKHFTRRSYTEHLQKCSRYTELQAQRWHEQGRRSSFLQMLLRPPLRFLRSYVALGGFLDGMAGLHIAYMAAYYAFLKQARLWELNHGRTGDEDTPGENTPHRNAA